MQIAVSGTYSKGQIILDEVPPIESETSEVMVVFLPHKGLKDKSSHDMEAKSFLESIDLLSMDELGGILTDCVSERLSDKDMSEAIGQGIMKRSMMDDI